MAASRAAGAGCDAPCTATTVDLSATTGAAAVAAGASTVHSDLDLEDLLVMA